MTAQDAESGIDRARSIAEASNRQLLIGGKLRAAKDGAAMPVVSPIDDIETSMVPRAAADDVDASVAAARSAYDGWRRSPLVERRTRVLRLAEVIRADAENLAALDCLDTGAISASMRAEVEHAAFTIEWFASLAFSWGGREVPVARRALDFTTREPYGVVAWIVAFNHPLFFGATKLAATLLVGNTVVLKVPDQAPSSMLRLSEALADLFPPGVVNVISGVGPEAGGALVRHPQVGAIGFIGSPRTGKLILSAAAERVVPAILELGGKNPFIVCPDADLDRASATAVAGMNFKTAGQSCGSYSRLFVHDDIHDEVVERVAAAFTGIRVGDPFDPGTGMGPVIDAAAVERCERHVWDAIERGAHVGCGGERIEVEGLEGGHFLQPTLVTGVTQDMPIASEEIFGPVLAVLRWREVPEVIRDANAVAYGLTGAVWSRDIDRALAIAQDLETGSVAVNGDGRLHWPGAPFGGYKESGYGKQDSVDEVLNWTREKNINIQLHVDEG